MLATTVGIVSLLAATLFWAGNYVVGAAAVAELPPLSLVFLRWLLAVVPLLIIAQVIERPRWREVARAWPWLLVLSGFGLLGYNLLLYSALEHTTALNASLINAFNPALISLAAVVFLRQRLTPLAVLGILISLVGVLVVLTGGNPAAILTTGFGVGEICVWTGYTIAGRLAPPLPPITATAAQALITVVVLAPFVLITGGPVLPSTARAGAALLFIAVFPSVLSYVLWNRALAVIRPARAGVFLNLITVFTAAFTIISGQSYSAAQVVGGLVVIGGVVLTNVVGTQTAVEPADDDVARPVEAQ